MLAEYVIVTSHTHVNLQYRIWLDVMYKTRLHYFAIDGAMVLAFARGDCCGAAGTTTSSNSSCDTALIVKASERWLLAQDCSRDNLVPYKRQYRTQQDQGQQECWLEGMDDVRATKLPTAYSCYHNMMTSVFCADEYIVLASLQRDLTKACLLMLRLQASRLWMSSALTVANKRQSMPRP